jgi:catechol 2,3-dioxygenase-like lactoylglutathione lyase family enzyme
MANTEWLQRGPVDGVPAVLQPVAHILLQVRESVGEIVEPLTEQEWNARPAGVASAAFHVRHIAGVIDRLFTYARGNALSAEQFSAIQGEGQELVTADIPVVLGALSTRVDAAVAELRTIDVTTLSHVRRVGRAQLPSTVIGCLVHGAEHAMRHVGQLSVTARIVRSHEQPDICSVAPFFIVQDLAAALLFYRDRLGFDITFQGPADDPFFGIVRRGGAMIMLKVVGVAPLPNYKRQTEARWDAYLNAQDPDLLAAEFLARGVEFSQPLKDDDDGLRGFEVKDADGYVLFFGRPRA